MSWLLVAVEEEAPEPDGKEKIAEQRVFQPNERERRRPQIGGGKKDAAGGAEQHRQPVAEDYVHETKGDRARGDHRGAASKDGLVAPEEIGPKQELLG